MVEIKARDKNVRGIGMDLGKGTGWNASQGPFKDQGHFSDHFLTYHIPWKELELGFLV